MKTLESKSHGTLIGIVLLVLGCTQVWAHPDDTLLTIVQPLRDDLRNIPTGTMLSIVIWGDVQQCESVAHALAATDGAPTFDQPAARRDAAMKLRDATRLEQADLLALLKRLEGQGMVRNERPLWVVNAIGVEATPDAVRKIADEPSVARISLDLPGRLLGPPRPSRDVGYIGADQAWALRPPDPRDRNIVVGVVDTGVDRLHPDLHVWVNDDAVGAGPNPCPGFDPNDDDCNGYVDDTWGWNFDDRTPLSCDLNGHGTAVAGVIGGTGSISEIITGVAPAVRIMPLRIALPNTGEASQVQACEALQYAWANDARIANVSMDWAAIGSYEPDWVMWRTLTECLTDLGLFIVAGAGNYDDHPNPPEGVAVPARAPRVLAVGALQLDADPPDSTNLIQKIKADSGLGPSSWQGVMPCPSPPDPTVPCWDDFEYPPEMLVPPAPLGLLKPDLIAPGAGVRTTKPWCTIPQCFDCCPFSVGSYTLPQIQDLLLTTEDGTSMAAPQAAGVAALLLEKDDTLLPHDLMYILRETARPIPPAPLDHSDNVFGYGVLQALTAVQFPYPQVPTYDLSITESGDLWTTTDIWVDNDWDTTPDVPYVGEPQQLYATVRNLSQQAVGNVQVRFYYADVGTIGITGFDPNGDGDPSDGNFRYIDTYRIPVLGPVDSRQGVAEVVVPWNVPAPETDHWCVGVSVSAPNPPNVPEQNVSNNVAFRNFFEIVLNYSANHAMFFAAYPNPQHPDEPFDMQFDRHGLPDTYGVKIIMPEPLASKWFDDAQGFVRVKDDEPHVDVSQETLLRPERYAIMRLDRPVGLLRNVTAPDGKPVRLKIVITAPSRREAAALEGTTESLLVIDARSGEEEPYGKFTLDIRTEARPSEKEKPKRPVPASD